MSVEANGPANICPISSTRRPSRDLRPFECSASIIDLILGQNLSFPLVGWCNIPEYGLHRFLFAIRETNQRAETSPSIMNSYNLLYQRGESPVRWVWYFDTPARDEAIPFFRNLGDFRGIGNDYIWNARVSDEGWQSGLECTTSKPIKPILTTHAVQNPHTVECSCSDPIDYEKVRGYRDVRAGLEDGLRITFLHTYSEGGYGALFSPA
jgi:hypothetical protein